MTIDQLIEKLTQFREEAYLKGATCVYVAFDPPGEESGIEAIAIDRAVLDGDHRTAHDAGVVMLCCKWWPYEGKKS